MSLKQWMQKIQNNSFLGKDLQGNHQKRGNKISKERRDLVKSHVNSVPRLESHYSKSDTQREYFVEGNLNIKKMYKMYIQWLNVNYPDHIPVSEYTYRHIFNYEFNIGFNKPKKDLCDRCKAHSFKTSDEKIILKNTLGTKI